MNRLFFRFFILVMLSISAAAFIVYFAINRLFGDPLDSIARRQAAAQIFLLEQYIDQAPADEWLDRLNRVREVSGVRFELVPLSEVRKQISGQDAAGFERGGVVLDIGRKAFYRRVDLVGERYIGSNDEALVAQDLPIDIGFALSMEAVRYLIVALVLLIPIAAWSRSHWQGLQQLSDVADRFGGGELGARAHMEPEDSIYPLAERINHMADRIERLLDSQRNLLHSVGHEIRTPIARLEFALELLRDVAENPALDKRINAMEGDLRELKELVNELLGMTRLDAEPHLQRKRFDLGSALAHCSETLPPSEGMALEMELGEKLGQINGEQRLLERAVGNLLRNALKYGTHTVRLSAVRMNDVVQVAVEDDGPGIPYAERERVFEPFYRLDRSRDRNTGGFGLGLSIARKAVELHGGTLAVGTSALGGARFTITLPG